MPNKSSISGHLGIFVYQPAESIATNADDGWSATRKVGAVGAVLLDVVRGADGGERGPGGFPAPVARQRSSNPLWSWAEVESWFQRRGCFVSGRQDALDAENTVPLCLEGDGELGEDRGEPAVSESISTPNSVVPCRAPVSRTPARQ